MCIKHRTLGPGKAFTVHSRGVFPKRNRAISSMVKYYGKNGTGKSVHYEEVFTNPGCSL